MKTIIEMAREAGFMLVAEPSVEGSDWYECFTEEIEDFAALVRAEEREACAKVCEEDLRDEYIRQDRPVQDEVNLFAAIADCAAAIRARGNT